MSAPSIELRWGKGFDVQKRRDTLRPVVTSAIHLAQVGLANSGLTYREPKRVLVEVADPGERLYGLSTKNTCTLLYTPKRIYQRHDIIRTAALVFHEIVHSVRSEYWITDSVFEKAASEGLAYISDYNFANELYELSGRNGPKLRWVERAQTIPAQELRTMRRSFLRTGASQEAWDDERQYHDLVSKIIKPYGFGRAEMIGINAVARHLQEGREIAELIPLHPEEVIRAA